MSEEYVDHCKRCCGPGTWRNKKPHAYMGVYKYSTFVGFLQALEKDICSILPWEFVKDPTSAKSIIPFMEKPKKRYMMSYTQVCKCGMTLHTMEIHEGTCPKELRKLKPFHL